MHLKSLTLKGFKSFASAATLRFEPGICAVVGPNGSGKSNVVDALAWVMGEHSAKTLRGGSMEDVIFAGTSGRAALGRAEVTLTIDNADGALPIDYSEVSVTRRMFRDGASEYEINGARCRLMDVQELLSDTGIGREMHIIVGQGRLGQILESKPEDRRAFIEEAAGVLKHRRRKEKAQRKLHSMQANLDRLQDLTGELHRQLKPLARQAEAAKRAATVQADLREAKLNLAAADLTRKRQALTDRTRTAEILAEQVLAAEEAAEEAAETLTTLEDDLAAVTPAADAAQQEWFRLSALQERVSATVRIAADRARSTTETRWTGPDPEELRERADRLDAEQEELDATVEAALDTLTDIREQVAEAEARARAADAEHMAAVRAQADRREGVVRLVAAEESLRARITAAEDEIERLREQAGSVDKRRDAAETEADAAATELSEAEAAMPQLEDRQQRRAQERDQAETRLQQLRKQERELERRISGLDARIEAIAAMVAASRTDGAAWLQKNQQVTALSELLAVQGGWDSAVAAALGDAADAVVAYDNADTMMEALTEANGGHATVIEAGGSPWRLDVDLPSGARWALDAITIPEDIAGGVTALLVDVVLVDDAAAARGLVAADNRLRAVTADGRIYGAGWVRGGSGSQRSAVELGAESAGLSDEAKAARGELDNLAATLSGAEAEAEERRTEAAGAKAALREQQSQVKTLAQHVARLQKTAAAVVREAETMGQRTQEAEDRLANLRSEYDELSDRLARLDDEPDDDEPSTELRDSAAEELARARAAETEARLVLRTSEERAGQGRGKAEGLRRQAHYEEQQRSRHEAAMVRQRAARELAVAVTELGADLVDRVRGAADAAARRKDAFVGRKAQVQAALQQARQQASATQQHLARLKDSAHKEDLAQSESRVLMEQAEAAVMEQLGVTGDDLLEQYAPGPDFDEAEEQKRLKRAERDLRALGKVNPLALEEYAAMEERYQFLATQLDDVQRARADLRQVIEDVDATILQLFTEAWLDVEKEFPAVFQTLFPGGEGRLVLTEPEDMLTTGIELEARPPGKRVKRLSLLSGGEKSLTALAMLVAIFRARPSPFYVLDEVEAALDDVNLRRLLNLLLELRESSQLIVITHQKPTMDIANVLYGVTMRGDGVTRVISQRMSPTT
ncbi:chromosome segregation protein SMC [Corynebacterium ulceribovis]|uniref:chromosome segregation protein SMC n=1 Tax=Corynebacterium ulceribovis TaxID=487732 RepID=UPI000366A963|nr:chromosome segregation protein SMC [Corynebacterium ulceribovis]